jgi:hypothetical protein
MSGSSFLALASEGLAQRAAETGPAPASLQLSFLEGEFARSASLPDRLVALTGPQWTGGNPDRPAKYFIRLGPTVLAEHSATGILAGSRFAPPGGGRPTLLACEGIAGSLIHPLDEL